MAMRTACTNGVPAHNRHSHVARVMRPCFRNVRTKGGVYVPSDSFGGQSPERKAAGILRTFFTFVAARMRRKADKGDLSLCCLLGLLAMPPNVPMKDGDEWLALITRQNTSLGLRLMEVRDHYCEEAFEWDQLQRLAKKDMKGANTKLMRQFAAASLAASLTADEAAASSRSLAGWRSAAEADGASGGAAADARDAPAAAAPTGADRGTTDRGAAGGGETANASEQLVVNSGGGAPEGRSTYAGEPAAGASSPTTGIEPSASSSTRPVDFPPAAPSEGPSEHSDLPHEDPPPPACPPPVC
ncbi:hypothetical protein VOLCADRAFT_98547 [Volvox carteri f. nagariensis]|uniref:Uncharacterized protein n=1 Tax=Volvox carteri f. nagariensis TaxID=3068 RepID=D8UFM5_VOLCA|nr:uncharacterized protein VOLCADRAFT_98547 [Volvox carteri f. nagariensis]EFJ41529.1 hypothetical protein VOLCADRAFT_98547 [Volvox carteri f. nagariensis]|eukprot:XP_002957474.1 hypothetical protein VOLCADRAFT_98547 [Volvox carteri f. nagariensis]